MAQSRASSKGSPEPASKKRFRGLRGGFESLGLRVLKGARVQGLGFRASRH